MEGLCRAFDDHHVLRGVDLEIHRGEVVAMVGGSGCGKTVILNHILGLLSPDVGRVLVADHRQPGTPLVDPSLLNDAELDAIHTHWGVVFQNNALFSGTVYDNISLWLEEVKELGDDAITSIACSVLTAVSLPTDDDFLNTDTNDLSGGMAKRLAVARALSMEPNVIFYDEPTTGLDPSSALQIQDLILTTHFDRKTGDSERTTVIITHDKDLLGRLQPRTVMLHEGRVSFDGPFREFESSGSPLIRPYFDLMPVLHEKAATG